MREERSGMLKWDDDSKNNVDFNKKQDYARKKIRCLFRVEEDSTIDLTGYDLGNVRTLRDYEKYAGVNFKTRAVQKYTVDNKYPPNPLIENDELWEQSFMESFYHLVNIDKNLFSRNDYKFVLVAFDDENGNSLKTTFIDDGRLNYFNEGNNIHYEEFFLTHKIPARVVYWAYSEEIGWCERFEINLDKK
jgi:hypothetical protein